MEGESPTIELDVKDVMSDGEGQAPESESSTDTEAKPVEGESQDDADGDTEGDAEADDAADEADDDAEADKTDETDDQPKKGAEVRKSELQGEIRSLVARRNELRVEVARVNSQAYKPQSAEEIIAETGADPAMAEVQALRQEQKMAEFNNYVTDLNASINTESLQVMADFPLFDPQSKDYDAGLSKRAAELYKRVANIQTDPKTGLTIRANVLPYDVYKAIAETAQSGTRQGAVKGQRAAEKMLAAADATPSGGEATKPRKEDPFLAGLTRGLKVSK